MPVDPDSKSLIPKTPAFQHLSRSFQFNIRITESERNAIAVLAVHLQLRPAEVMRMAMKSLYERVIAAPTREENKRKAYAAEIQEAVTAAYQSISREQMLLAEEMFAEARQKITASDISAHDKRKLLHQLSSETLYERKERIENEYNARDQLQLMDVDVGIAPPKLRPVAELVDELRRKKAEAAWARREGKGVDDAEGSVEAVDPRAAAGDGAPRRTRSPRKGKGAAAPLEVRKKVGDARSRHRVVRRSK